MKTGTSNFCQCHSYINLCPFRCGYVIASSGLRCQSDQTHQCSCTHTNISEQTDPPGQLDIFAHLIPCFVSESAQKQIPQIFDVLLLMLLFCSFQHLAQLCYASSDAKDLFWTLYSIECRSVCSVYCRKHWLKCTVVMKIFLNYRAPYH